MNSRIETPRLVLVRLINTSEGSQHVEWFHRFWNDDSITAWSLHGKIKTVAESRLWMIKTQTEFDSMNYAVFAKTPTSKGTEDDPGELVGNASLWRGAKPALMPPRSFNPDASKEWLNGSVKEEADKSLNLRMVAYALFQPFYGKGYATEATKALMDEYASFLAPENATGEQRFYIEAGVDKDNPKSQQVLQRLGFSKVGWKEEDEKVFLNGEWRDPGYWVYGKYVF